jgi:hypothetical protein
VTQQWYWYTHRHQLAADLTQAADHQATPMSARVHQQGQYQSGKAVKQTLFNTKSAQQLLVTDAV